MGVHDGFCNEFTMMFYLLRDANNGDVTNYVVCFVYLPKLFWFKFVGENSFEVSFQFDQSPVDMDLLCGVFCLYFPLQLY